jgi:hypothetical protein
MVRLKLMNVIPTTSAQFKVASFNEMGMSDLSIKSSRVVQVNQVNPYLV